MTNTWLPALEYYRRYEPTKLEVIKCEMCGRDAVDIAESGRWLCPVCAMIADENLAKQFKPVRRGR